MTDGPIAADGPSFPRTSDKGLPESTSMAHEIFDLIARHGLLVVFLSVFVAKAGVPLPAVPTLAIAGALAAVGQLSLGGILPVAVIACLLADLLWYAAGRQFGGSLLRLLCRVALSPDSCVRHAGRHFERWQGKLLLISKFLPGVSALAAPLVGAMGLPVRVFLLLDGLGSLLWAGTAVGLGYLFAAQIDGVLQALADAGKAVLGVVLGLLALYVLGRWWWRRRLLLALRMPRITVDDLQRSMAGGRPPAVVDVRTKTSRRLDPRIVSGAVLADFNDVEQTLHGLSHDADVVTYCDCPNEASSAQAAKALMAQGYRSVRPLQGGLSAWAAAGYPMQPLPLAKTAAPAFAASAVP